jgi:peptidoglycan hydrolase-like protein with peptidoglycan-binding domain
MRRLPALPLAASLLLLSPAAFASVRTHRHGSTHAIVRRTASTHASHSSHFSDRPTYGMSSERATEIQSALIQRGYLTGEPTGTWDSASVAAMQKLQGDNGWQTKLTPDSRALIKLGLGPGSTSAPLNTATTPGMSTTADAQTPLSPASN